ncbi:hypothetical protein ACTAQI_03895 [Pseudarthrobacter sp. alpha12b]
MNSIREFGRQRWFAVGIVALLTGGALFLLWPSDRSGREAAPLTPATVPAAGTPSASAPLHVQSTAAPIIEESSTAATDGKLPSTRDYRSLALAAAQGIYTWDSRSSSYSDVYARVRSWWALLPDGSNPLSALVREFEGTGVTAGSFTVLTGQSARRTGTAEAVRCDRELAKVKEYPAPWEGLHVCTVTVQVVDESTAGQNAYAAPVTVMVNCPPAVTAPADRCAMVGFYATAERIVY